MELEWAETLDLIESVVPPERLIGRNVDILAGAVIVERLYAKLTDKAFDVKDAIWRVLNTGKWDGS